MLLLLMIAIALIFIALKKLWKDYIKGDNK